MAIASTCQSCGLVQRLTDTPRPHDRCVRCDYRLLPRHAAGPWEATLWLLLLLGSLTLAVFPPFMTFAFAGGANRTRLSDGPLEAIAFGSVVVGGAVLICSLIAPLLWGLGMLYVTAGLAAGRRGPGAAAVLRLMHGLRPWAMIEVFLLGVVVTAGKLGHDGQLSYGRGFDLYLAALGFWLIIGQRFSVPHFWERLQPSVPLPTGEPVPELAGCQTCGYAQQLPRVDTDCDLGCVRCGAELTEDPHGRLRRCVVLLLLSMLLLLPANLVPIMRIAELGPPEPKTVWEGIKVLYFGGSPGLALLVFLASLCTPILKVLVLAGLVLWRHPRRAATARRLAKVHRFIATIGRWSMVDLFVVALLIGLVRLGGLASVDPRLGAVAFLAVVVLTIAAAEELNPRIFWDHTRTQRNR